MFDELDESCTEYENSSTAACRETLAGLSVRGGWVRDRSSDPVIVLRNGREPNGEKGATHSYVLRAGQENDPNGADLDGIVVDPRFQPIVVPHSGNILIPAEIPIDAQVAKLKDTGILTVTGNWREVSCTTNIWLLRSYGTIGSLNLSGQQPVRPEPINPHSPRRSQARPATPMGFGAYQF